MKKSILKNVSIIMICSVFAKVLSYAWEAILAAFLGVSDEADAVYMVTSIFNILYPILDLGIWKVFLPVYKTQLSTTTEEDADNTANRATTLFAVISFSIVIFILAFAKPIVFVMAPGFSSAKRAITIEFLRFSAPMYLLMATSSIVGAVLQSRDKFLGSQIREIGTHASKIVFIIVCFRYFRVYAVLIAMIIGSVFRLIVQLPFVDWGWRFRLDFSFQKPEIKKMLQGLPSVAVTAAIAHINSFVDKIVASGAMSGAVASLNYGHRLMSVFSGMISTAIGTAVYPTMIQYIAEKKEKQLTKLIDNVISSLMYCIIPISIFSLFFATDIVAVAFQRGAFTESATAMTSRVFIGYCIGMLYVGIASIVNNVFYGYGDTRITMHISIAEILLNILFDIVLLKYWGVAGLAFATSVAAIICLCIRFYFIKRYISLDYKNMIWEYVKIVAVSVVACYVPFILFVKITIVNMYLALLFGAVLSAAIYIMLSVIFKLNAYTIVSKLIRRKLKKTR